jgi:hypothetical protein
MHLWLKLLKNLYHTTGRVATSLSLAVRNVYTSYTYRSTVPAREALAVPTLPLV